MATLRQQQTSVQAQDTFEARQLAKGLTLVPCWGISKDGRIIPCCKWVRLKPGETLSEAAHRLSLCARGGNI